MNGVPLRRVNPAYVIATSTKVDVAGLKLSDKLTDSYFTKPKAKKEKKAGAEEQFFAKAPKVTRLFSFRLRPFNVRRCRPRLP